MEPFHNANSGLRGERLYSERLAGHQIPDASEGDIEMDFATRKIGATSFMEEIPIRKLASLPRQYFEGPYSLAEKCTNATV